MSDAPSGILVLDKPPGWTSHDCVGFVRRRYGLKRVGHAGTLDPFATGVLVLCLGRATRLLEFITGCAKAYDAEVVLGVETDSYDVDGAVVGTADASAVTAEAVAAALATFLGEIDQIPPMASAKKIGGRKLYELHRKGQVVERPAARVVFHELALTSFTAGEQAIARVHVVCGPGTYVRSLAHDLGLMLGVGAHLRTLRRTRVGEYAVAEAATVDELEDESPAERLARLGPPERAVAHLPRVRLAPDCLERLVQGKPLEAEHLLDPQPEGEGPVAVFAEDGGLLAIAYERDGTLRPRKVLVGLADDD